MVLAAAGNDGLNLDASRRSFYPAAYGLSNVVVVGNQYENTNRPSRGSNYGKIVDFFARGNSVLSFFPECVDNARMSGTSQATPVVAAIMATYKAQYPDASWLEIYNHIAKASKPMEDSRLSKHGSINPSLVFSSPFKYVERTTASK